MTLILLFCILFTVSKPTQNVIINENDTDVLHILGAIQNTKDKNIIIIAESITNDSAPYNETSDYEELANYGHHDEVNSSKEKSILRWLPKKRVSHKKRQARVDAKFEQARIERNRLRAHALNAERVAHVSAVIQNNYWTTLYLHGEINRILKSREVIDEMTALIQKLEQNATLKEKVLKCYRDTKKTYDNNVWTGKTNNLVIHVVKDPINEGSGLK